MAKPIPGEKVLGVVSGVKIEVEENRPYNLIFTDKRVLSAWSHEGRQTVEPALELTEEVLKRVTGEVQAEKVKEVILKGNSLTVKAGMFSSVWVRFPEGDAEAVKAFVVSTPYSQKLKA